jgi:deoxyribonuclease-4
MSEILLGCHVSMSKPDYLLTSAQLAVSFGANTFMFYTGAPQNSVRIPIDQLKISEFRQYLTEHKINIQNLVVHAPYIVNIASDDRFKKIMAVRILKEEIKRTEKIGCKYLVLHSGNAIGISKDIAIQNAIDNLNELNQFNKNVIICLETMSGKGTEIGRNFDELTKIIQGVKNKKLIGVCLDTCHINDAGYDPKKIDDVLNQFEKIIGLNYLKVIHLNDSKNTLGAHKDRHENIGYGTIGFDTLLKYVYDERLKNIPKILETP